MFLISTFPTNSSKNFYDFWYLISDNKLNKTEMNFTTLFDGFLYKQQKQSQYPNINLEKPEDGEYIYLKFDKNKRLQLYVSPTGCKTIYYYYKNNMLAVTDNLPLLLENVKFHVSDININVVKDFYALSYPIGEETFIKNINRFPSGQVMCFDYYENILKFEKFFNIKLNAFSNRKINVTIEEMDKLFSESVFQCLNHYGTEKKYCLALSNGMDSRLMAYFFKKNNVDLFSYFFGEPYSLECSHATKIAGLLDIPLYYGKKYEDFYQHINEYSIMRPFANVEWSKYVIAKKDVPDYDVILSGYMGNHLYGGWEFSCSNKEKSDTALSEELLEKFNRVSNICAEEKSRLVERIKNLLKQNNENVLSKKWEFYFRTAIAYEKDCEFFTDLNDKRHFSLFCNINVVRHSFTYSLSEYQFRRLYMEYLKQKCLLIHPSRVPAIQVVNSHKPIEKWVCNQAFIQQFLKKRELIEFVAFDLCKVSFDFDKLIENIKSGAVTRDSIHILFRLLTVAELITNFL